ncbi:MAG: energy transducer TonB [Planctomycetota bacterium]
MNITRSRRQLPWRTAAFVCIVSFACKSSEYSPVDTNPEAPSGETLQERGEQHANKPIESRRARKPVVLEGTGILITPKPIPGKTPGPIYPEMERLAGHEGNVVIRVTVTLDGEPVDAHVEESSGFLNLDHAAKSAAELWRFTPASWQGNKIEYDVLLPFRFQLKNADPKQPN